MNEHIQQLLKSQPDGREVEVRGWVRTRRDTGTFSFLEINDGSCLSNVQVIADSNGAPVILGDWSQVLLGIWSELDILVNPFDSVAYARGGVLVRAMATVDTAVRHPKAFVVASDVAL